MSDPTPIKHLDWHGKRLGALFKAAADAGYIRLVGAENAAREESKGHLIRTRKALPAHVCEVSAA